MGNVPMNRTDFTSVDDILADELARADRALSGVAPVISHLLDPSSETLVNDAILARVRGMLAHLSHTLLGAGLSPAQRGEIDASAIDALSSDLADIPAILSHLYCVAVEGLLTERLEQRFGIDPVLSPLVQELIASDQPTTAELAMRALTAQSRFMQSQGRMELALSELPAEIFAAVLKRFETFNPLSSSQDRQNSISEVRRNYDEAAGRIGLLSRLVVGMRNGAIAGLALDHAGFALFVSSLSELSGQPRNLAVISSHERQNARLALSLRAAGLEGEQIDRQLQLLGPASPHADNIADMSPERARAVLARSMTGEAFAVGAG